MRVEKLRGATDDTGLVPAGKVFALLARKLEPSRTQESVRRIRSDAKDPRLEASYRRASASRSNTFADTRTLM